jgi:hypothetical protein
MDFNAILMYSKLLLTSFLLILEKIEIRCVYVPIPINLNYYLSGIDFGVYKIGSKLS